MREIVDAGDRGLISQIDESAGILSRPDATTAREFQRRDVVGRKRGKSRKRGYFQRHDVGRQKAREIQRRGEGQGKAREIQRSDVDRRRGSPRERRRSREIEE